MSESSAGATAFDIGTALGAIRLPAVDRLTLYIPDKDCEERPVADVEAWIEYGMQLLTELNGGVTRLPWASGRWKRPDGEVVQEQTTVLYSSLTDPERFVEGARRVRAFLHEFGHRTNQGAVMFDISGIEDRVGESDAVVAPHFVIRSYEIPASDYDTPEVEA